MYRSCSYSLRANRCNCDFELWYTAAALPTFMGDGVVAEEDIGDFAATADQAGGVSAHMMDQENVAPGAGKQHLPAEA